MKVSTKIEGDRCIVTVQEDRIDAAVALAFKDAMRRNTVGSGAMVILNLAQVQFIDSSGLGAIVATMKHLAPDRKLVLAGLTAPVERVFTLTRMDSVFDLFANLDDALAVHHA